MSINKSIEMKENAYKKYGGCIFAHYPYVSSYHRPSDWVSNRSLDEVLLPIGMICKKRLM